MSDGITLVESYGQPTYGAFDRGMEYIAARGFDGFLKLYQFGTNDDAWDVTEEVAGYPYLSLDLIPCTKRGDDVVISGKTNRPDETLFIFTVSGVSVEETATLEVVNGTITATFDTTDLPVYRNYHVTVEDVDKIVSDQAKFEVGCYPTIFITLEVTPMTAKVGDRVTAKAIAINAGTYEDSETVSLRLDSVEVKSKVVTLAPGDRETVEYTFVVTEDMVGTHTIELGGQSATLTVNDTRLEETPMSSEPKTPLPTPTEEEPGFEAVFTVTGLLTVAYLVLKRKIK